MEIKELQENQNAIANKLLKIDCYITEYESKIENDIKYNRERDKKFSSDFNKFLNITEKFTRYYLDFKINRYIFWIFIVFVIINISLVAYLNSQLNDLIELNKSLKKNQYNIIQVLEGDRKFWVDNENHIYWDSIKNIPEEVKKPTSKNKKKGK